MNNAEKKFHDQIEVERIWIATEQGKYVFFSMLLVSTFLILGLWDSAPPDLLLLWFSLLTSLNLFTWMLLRFYHDRKKALIANIQKFKYIL